MNKEIKKSKEERLFEMYVKNIIDETQFKKMYERIKKSKENKK